MADQYPIGCKYLLQLFSKNLRRDKIALQQRLRTRLKAFSRSAKMRRFFYLQGVHRSKTARAMPGRQCTLHTRSPALLCAAIVKHSDPVAAFLNLPTRVPPDETRTNRRDCSGLPRLLLQKRHRRCRTRLEYVYAFHHHDCTHAPPRCVSRLRLDLMI